MGLEIYDIKKIKALKESTRAEWKKIAILGDCKFYFKWSDIDSTREGEFDLDSLREFLGADEIQTFDLFGNPTVVQDLHEPINKKFENYFDVVFDAGTLFCCFDIACVWKNIFSIVKDNGYIWHLAGLVGYFGRSYYSFHPMLFRDFYKTNNFEILNLSVRSKEVKPKWWMRAKKNSLDWIDLDNNDVYYSGIDKDGKLGFSPKNKGKSRFIYTDSVISCFVKCNGEKTFKRAIPPFYGS